MIIQKMIAVSSRELKNSMFVKMGLVELLILFIIEKTIFPFL